MKKLDDVFAENLKRLMDDRGLSQSAVQRMSGVAQTAVSAIVRGHSSPSLSTVEQICRGLRVTPWTMIVPEFPHRLLGDHRLPLIIQRYVTISDEGRDYIDRVAEQEARYTTEPGIFPRHEQ